MKRGRAVSARALACALLGAALVVGCAGRGPTPQAPVIIADPFRISEAAAAGDARRRASTRLVLEGLATADSDRARTQFERAIALDATNPYAYLALASQEIQWGDVDRGTQSLRQAELLLRSEHLDSPRVAPHLTGLRGRAQFRGAAYPEGTSGEELLDEARRQAPSVWSDGWLSATELR